MARQREVAQKNWELENQVISDDQIYAFNEEENDKLVEAEPWKKDPHYFTGCKISAVALIKMVMHAKSGGNLEVMGLMQGKVIGHDFVIMDAFGLPVEGTETRVNAGAEAMEYMVDYVTTGEVIGRLEGVCGWYHSHPGYNTWLSGIDVGTTMLHQQIEDPYCAIVIDPLRTISAGKVSIGAFRTYPEGYSPPDAGESEYQHIPLDKIEDFGVHYKSYYELNVSFFKSSLDSLILESLWHKYWVQTLSSNSLIANRDYATSEIVDLAAKLDKVEFRHSRRGAQGEEKESELSQVSKDASRIGIEQAQGLTTLLYKNLMFHKTSAALN